MHPLTALTLVALSACGTKADSGGTTPTGGPGTGSGTPIEPDTGIALLFWYAELESDLGVLVSGSFGLQARYVPDAFGAPDIGGSTAVCAALSPLTLGLPAVATCAACEFQFMTTLGPTAVDGSACDLMPGFGSVDLEGDAWGFGYQASVDYAGVSYEKAIMMYDPAAPEAGWWPFFVAAPEGGNMVTVGAAGTGLAVEGFRAIYNYYYYAPYYYVVPRP